MKINQRPPLRGWIITDTGKPLWHTIRRTKPEAWAAWEAEEQPRAGISYATEARPVWVKIDSAG